MKLTADRPPHFPDPNVDAVAVLEAALRERDEMLADAHKEAKAWQAQLQTALARAERLEDVARVMFDERNLARDEVLFLAQKLDSLGYAAPSAPTSSNIGRG